MQSLFPLVSEEPCSAQPNAPEHVAKSDVDEAVSLSAPLPVASSITRMSLFRS